MTSTRAIYRGHAGEASARFRPASRPPGYRTEKGTTGHFLAAPADTGGRFSLYRWDMSAASGGPGPHFHRTYDETFYILAGTVRLYDGTRWLDASPGDMLYVPAGGVHGFTNNSGAPASMLMFLTPGADRAAYFNELSAIAASGRELSDPEWADIFARHDNVMLSPAADPTNQTAGNTVRERDPDVGERYGIEVIGPPRPARPAARRSVE